MDNLEETLASEPKTGSEYVYEALLDAGIDLLVGLPGTQTLPLDRVVVENDDIRYVMARHETAIPHIAWGYYETCGTPAATITVPGPGDTNAMHGLKNAYQDCVPIIHISADIDPKDRGKEPIHEIEPDTYDNVVKTNINVERPIDLRSSVERGIQTALTPPYGPVRLGIPSGFLETTIESPKSSITLATENYDNQNAYTQAIKLLAAADRPLLYAGGGLRRSASGHTALRELADQLNAPVVTSYKGKGTFSEDDPRFLGVTGSHLPAGAKLALECADVVVALGTDFDGVTTNSWELPMGERLIHVNLDIDDIGQAYDPNVTILDDAGEAASKLASALRDQGTHSYWDGKEVARLARAEYEDQLREQGVLDETVPANTASLLTMLRDVLPRETIVTTDVGGFRLWAMQLFETYSPDQFVAGGSWAGMGVGVPAAIGAKLACPDRPVVALVGDGGLMMNLQECHTASEYGLDINVIVSNNNDYGVISKSPKIKEYGEDSHEFTWKSPSFETIAEGFGWEAHATAGVEEARQRLRKSLNNGEPTMIDVDVRTEEPTAATAVDYETSIDL